MNNLPHFLGIGAQKAGTTWLYRQLKQHPSIFMPDRKELRFFFDANQSVEWYREHFNAARPDQLCGEITPEYMIKREAASEIAQLLPQVKLVCLLRDPTERAFSQWCMARQLGNIPKDTPLLTAFQQNLQFMRERGHYVEHLEYYGNWFPDSQMKVFFYDDLVLDPHELWREVLRFLGVGDGFVPANLIAPVNRRESNERMSEEDRTIIAEYYAPWNQRLSRLLGQSRGSWSG
jgi:hypothetical protein